MHTSCGQGGDIKHRITLNVGFQEVITKYSVMSYYQVGRVIIKAMWTMIDDLQCLLFTRCHNVHVPEFLYTILLFFTIMHLLHLLLLLPFFLWLSTRQ